jgi:hypothetical protein
MTRKNPIKMGAIKILGRTSIPEDFGLAPPNKDTKHAKVKPVQRMAPPALLTTPTRILSGSFLDGRPVKGAAPMASVLRNPDTQREAHRAVEGGSTENG